MRVTPETIKDLRELLPGWNIFHGRIHGYRNLYQVSVVTPDGSKQFSFKARVKSIAVGQVYMRADAYSPPAPDDAPEGQP